MAGFEASAANIGALKAFKCLIIYKIDKILNYYLTRATDVLDFTLTV